MNWAENFLSSGFDFSSDENLQKFRFALLNSTVASSAFFTILNYFASLLNVFYMGEVYENMLLFYATVSSASLFLLRYNKKLYLIVTNIAIFSSIALFFFALVKVTQDEFRLIWFFIVLFAGFVLIGKKYGIYLMIFIVISILSISLNYDLQLLPLSLFTFFNSFVLFSIFSYFFISKIEKDSYEFTILNKMLQNKVHHEIKQRKEQEKMLLQQCRLASMGEMIDSIAHQWRQPLMNINAILMNLERAIEEKEKPQQYLENKMSDVIDLTSHMSQTIEDFRQLFRSDKNKSYFYLQDPVAQALQIFDYKSRGITIQNSFESNPSYHGYFNEIVQVVLIILSNSAEIFADSNISKQKITINGYKKDKDIFLTIMDNAGGINPKHIESIFDPYFTTKSSTGGTGLGLYVAKIIIEQNNKGKLSAINVPNGAKFIIQLKEN